ncbi:hypothetical protein [Sphingomonas sp.]|uniref:hypothetical protein n=1 Tax=Sphingomonas sp. TaxID=28214 RepID=UPI003B3BB1AA
MPVSAQSGRVVFTAVTLLLASSIAGAASAQINWGKSAYREDSRTCERFGAAHGKDYSRCMLAQQQRRDNAPLYAAEQQRNNAEAARNNVETVRRIRCNREAKRAARRGERPLPC